MNFYVMRHARNCSYFQSISKEKEINKAPQEMQQGAEIYRPPPAPMQPEEMKQESEMYRPPPMLYQLQAETQKSCSFFCKVNNFSSYVTSKMCH